MKAIKRSVAALLAALMLSLSVNVSFAAETYTEDEAVAVAKVNAAGIMTGTDNGFEPSKTLTRAEAAAIMVRMKGISESSVKSAAGTTLFTDVAASHWASGYINTASTLGLIKGISATEFAPDREVTIAEFVTMAVRAIGAGTVVDAQNGTWPTNYVSFANEEGLLDNVYNIYTSTASRMNAATIVANSIETSLWEKKKATTNNEVTWEKDDTKSLLTDTLKYDLVENFTLTNINYSDEEVTVSLDSDKYYPTTFTGDVDIQEGYDMASLKLGYAYDGYFDAKKDVLLGVWKADSSKIETSTFTEITKYSSSKIKVVEEDGDEEEYDYATGAKFYFNNEELDDEDDFEDVFDDVNKENVFGTLSIVDDEVTAVYAHAYTYVGLVDEVTSTRIKFDDLDGVDTSLDSAETIKKDSDDNTFFVTKNGKSIDIDDIKEDDVLFYYTEGNNGEDYHILVASNATIEGEVDAIGSTYIKVDGKKYTTSTTLSDKPDTEDDVVLYLNEAGKVVAYQDVEGTSNFAVIKSLEYTKSTKGKVEASVVLAYSDGSESKELKVKCDDDNSALTDIYDLLTYARFITTKSFTADSTGYLDDVASQTLVAGTTYYEVIETTKYYTTEAKAIAAAKTYALASVIDGDDVKELNTEVEGENKAYGTYKNSSLLGDVVKYDIDGDDVIIKKDTNSDILDTAITNYVSGTKKYFAQSTGKYYVTNTTKVLNIKYVSDDDDFYKVKVNVLDASTLETTDDGFYATVVDVDADTKNAKLVVIDERYGSKIKKGNEEEDWMIVIDKADTKEDYDLIVTLVDVNGNEYEYYTDESLSLLDIGIVTVETDEDGLKELTELDDEDGDIEYDITSFGSIALSAVKAAIDGKTYSDLGFVYEEKDGTLFIVDGDDLPCAKLDNVLHDVVLSDEVLYLKLEDGELSVGKEKDIDTIADDGKDKDDAIIASDLDNYTPIYGYLTSQDGIKTEVIAIIYCAD